MKTPVIIPAYNEENRLRLTLASLPAETTEPVVVSNGSIDQTADIARAFGVRTIEREQQGKLPAIQYVLGEMGKRALEPLVILDADTRPLFPHLWQRAMVRELEPDANYPVALGGPVWFTGSDIVSSTVRSLRRAGRAIQTRGGESGRVGQCGPNMGLHLQDQGVLDDVLALPHFWPGEDYALIKTVTNHDGVFKQPITPWLYTLAPPSVSFQSLHDRKVLGVQESRRRTSAAYRKRAAPGSIPYDRFE